MKTKSGKGYFYAKGQKARTEHSWVDGTTEHGYVLRVLTKDIYPEWARNSFKAGFYGSHVNHGHYQYLS